MATHITQKDCHRVCKLVGEKEPLKHMSRWDAVFVNGLRVTVGGWSYAEGWSRGFTFFWPDEDKPVYDSPTFDSEGRYHGRGWHQRMADDILARLEQVKRGENVPEPIEIVIEICDDAHD